MKQKLSESSPDGSVAASREAYRNLLARYDLVRFSLQELEDARGSLQPQGGRIESGDIWFGAAVARLSSRKELSPQTVENVLRELMHAEYECYQAEWERDCHRQAWMSHSTFSLPG
jgi:hypothetical protein